MNKKIIYITSLILAATSVCSVVPNKVVNSMVSVEAHAASTDDLTSISISDSNEELDIYDNSNCKKSNKVDFSDDTPSTSTTYYAKTSKTRVKINVSGSDSDYVRIYKGSKAYKEDSSIPIDSSDTTSLEIRVYEDKYNDYTDKEKKDSKNYTKYKVRVKNTKSSSSSSSDDNDDSVYLSSIKLSDGEIDFSKKTRSYDINVPLSTDSIRIKAEPEDDDDTVRIDGYYVDENDKWRQDVSLKEGENTIKIEVEDDDGDDKRTYTLNIYRGKTSSDSSTTTTAGTIDNKQDAIYLDDIVLDDGDTNLKFNKKVTSYAIDYKENYDYIMVKAEPEDSDDQVRINDSEVDSDGWYKKKISLNKGKNVIKIQVDNSQDYDEDEDDYKERIYTLTVYRGTSEGTASGEKKEDSTVVTETKKINQWVKVADKWQYNDAAGNPLKNQMFYDRNYGKNYFLDNNGNMQTGFVTYAGNTYFADDDGGMHLGWKYVNNNWYHFNNYTGIMDQGWFQDNDGVWYYLYAGSGIMAHDTYIGQYRLGSSGAWIR